MTTRLGLSSPLLLAGLLSTLMHAQEPKTSVREYVTLAGTVDRLDRTRRLLTVRNDNATQDVYVPPEFTLFDELKVGDKVTARIRESIIVSTRPGLKPQRTTDTTADAAAKRQRASDPDVLQQLKAVVTIEGVDPVTHTVLYKTADNRRIIRAIADPRLIDGLKIGDVVEVTLTRERVVELQRQ